MSPTKNRLKQTRDDDDRFAPPSSAQVNDISKRAHKLHPPASPTAAAPARRTFFDPWNSGSTGHQRAENRLSGSTSWRTSRNLKLGEQYKGGLTGGRRVADTVGAGSEDFGKDGRKENGGWEKGAKGLRTGGQQSLADIWSASKAGKKSDSEKTALLPELDPESEQGTFLRVHTRPSRTVLSCLQALTLRSFEHPAYQITELETDLHHSALDPPSESQGKHIFEGLCFYVNGSTAPLVSDHKLKHLLAAHGARHSITLGRRTVTHVILGTVSAKGGAGGGLAATKIQKEVSRTGGKAVKYITVEW